MARRSSSSRSSSRYAGSRDLSTPVSRSLAPLRRQAAGDWWVREAFPDLSRRRAFLVSLNEVEDRRRWTPDRTRPAKALNRAATALTTPGQWEGSFHFNAPFLSPVIRFAKAVAVPICRRRWIRSQVLHALGLAGRRGLGAGKPRHRNGHSSVSCG